VVSPSWNNNAGAATWGNGNAGADGPVSSANSLNNLDYSQTTRDFALTVLPNGDYVVLEGESSGTWVNGTSGTTLDGVNTPDAQNTLVGGPVFSVLPLFSGSAFVMSSNGGGVSAGLTDPNLLSYALTEGQTITVTPDFLTRSLDAGTDVTLQANDDIVIDSPITETASPTAGSFTLQAGRSILLNAGINTAGGNLSLIANDTAADGVVEGLRDPGNAAITMASGVTLNTGGGALSVDLKNSTGNPGSISGTVFQDININGVQDSGEPGIAGQTLYLDLSGSGVFEAGDPISTTDASGNYQFTGLSDGTYTVRQVLLGGALLDTPASGSNQVTLSSGVGVSDVNFAEVPTSISVPLTLPLNTPFPKQGNANADFVEALYRAVLNRDAEPGGLAYWTGLLNSGALSRLQVVQGIRTSPEHFTQEVTDFYFTLLGRAPDPSGLQFWVQGLQDGLAEEQIAFDFLDSPEYLSKGDKYFVDHMYLSLLGRSFDPVGEANWLNSLGDDLSGNPTHPPSLTHEQVIMDFLRSPESLNRLVEGYYEVFLLRLADPQGLSDWLTALQQGGSFLTIGQQFLASDEFYNDAAAER